MIILIVNIPFLSTTPIHLPDRLWYTFRSLPELDLILVPCYNSTPLLPRHAFIRQLIDKLLHVGEGRLRAILRRSLVHPNMIDVAVPWLDPLLLASQPPRDVWQRVVRGEDKEEEDDVTSNE